MELYPNPDAAFSATNTKPISQFFTDASAGRLPSFSLLDPDYDTESQENPQNIVVGEAFLAKTVHAIGSSLAWRKTILIVMYDEHGGYYDHVPPPPALAPDSIAPQVQPGEPTYEGFARYGFRVPALVVSPYAKRGDVSHVLHDHTSVLAFVERKWNLPAMTYRDANANDLTDFLDLDAIAASTSSSCAAAIGSTPSASIASAAERTGSCSGCITTCQGSAAMRSLSARDTTSWRTGRSACRSTMRCLRRHSAATPKCRSGLFPGISVSWLAYDQNMCSYAEGSGFGGRSAKLAAFRGCGGTGLRARFRSVWAQALGGSSPSSRMRGTVHSERIVNAALELGVSGLNPPEIDRRLDLPRSTVRDWLAGAMPDTQRVDSCFVCGAGRDPSELPADYVYLLGLYLGDGCISTHDRGVYRLRIVLDLKYPGIIEDAATAIDHIRPGAALVQSRPDHCAEVSAYWKHWPCLFPQHGPGKKHHRTIRLSEWQTALARRWPDQLIRGLVHSDGCRFENTGSRWSWPRYTFANHSADILGIFCWACEQLGVHWIAYGQRTLYVSRKADVATLDDFIGPKR